MRDLSRDGRSAIGHHGLWVIAPVLSWLLLLGACSAGSGDLYVTTESFPGCVLSVVKIIEPGSNAGYAGNLYTALRETIEYGGVSWRVYDIEAGGWDVYLEWDCGTGSFSHRNGREGVFIEPGSPGNEWAAVWVGASDPVQTNVEQGSGPLDLQYFPN